MRKLSTRKVMDTALTTLKGRSRAKRTMWSRRAQEYEAKINSGDPVSIAEVVRDLHRGDDQPDQSYSERQMYQAALDRLARELAALEKIDEVGRGAKTGRHAQGGLSFRPARVGPGLMPGRTFGRSNVNPPRSRGPRRRALRFSRAKEWSPSA